MNKLNLTPESTTRLKLDLGSINKAIKERGPNGTEFQTQIEDFKNFIVSLGLVKEQQLYLVNTLSDMANLFSSKEFGAAKYQMNQVINRIEKMLNGK